MGFCVFGEDLAGGVFGVDGRLEETAPARRAGQGRERSAEGGLGDPWPGCAVATSPSPRAPPARRRAAARTGRRRRDRPGPPWPPPPPAARWRRRRPTSPHASAARSTRARAGCVRGGAESRPRLLYGHSLRRDYNRGRSCRARRGARGGTRQSVRVGSGVSRAVSSDPVNLVGERTGLLGDRLVQVGPVVHEPGAVVGRVAVGQRAVGDQPVDERPPLRPRRRGAGCCCRAGTPRPLVTGCRAGRRSRWFPRCASRATRPRLPSARRRPARRRGGPRRGRAVARAPAGSRCSRRSPR